MHEVAALRGAVATALERMRAAGGVRVTHIQLALGASGHFSEEGARQHLSEMLAGTAAADATLGFDWIPARFKCFDCLQQLESCAPVESLTCPQCGGLALQLSHSDDCYPSEIEIAFAEDRERARVG